MFLRTSPERVGQRRFAAPVNLAERVGCYQAHRGAVHGDSVRDSDKKRSKGLLWVGVINGDRKEIVKVSRQLVQVYDLAADPGELNTLASVDDQPSDALAACLARVAEGLGEPRHAGDPEA